VKILTGKHISRRTLIKGVGTTLALPLLESMSPAGRAFAQVAAPVRAGFIYFPHGATMSRWLKDTLAQHATTDIWEKAVLYHFIHAVMLFVLVQRRPLLAGAWVSFLVGILIFSGSLYVMAVTNVRWLGAITPIGGISFLVGWIWLLVAARRLGE
jgi:uncharacterized membrane protein YgdD (TMEM256/DUF423 family)